MELLLIKWIPRKHYSEFDELFMTLVLDLTHLFMASAEISWEAFGDKSPFLFPPVSSIFVCVHAVHAKNATAVEGYSYRLEV